jgi:putative SOS response-associated peptidase YedK
MILKERLNLKVSEEPVSRYNIAPTQEVPVIFNDYSDTLAFARWGIEGWHQHPLFNARGESVDEKPIFKKAFESSRCLLAADAFYEWMKPSKRPFRIFLKSEEPFLFAGIFEEGESQRRCCMITCRSNDLVGKIHNRMPVILPAGLENEYLDASVKEAKQMLMPFPAEKMDMYEIGKAINSSKSDSADLIKKHETKTLQDFMG